MSELLASSAYSLLKCNSSSSPLLFFFLFFLLLFFLLLLYCKHLAQTRQTRHSRPLKVTSETLHGLILHRDDHSYLPPPPPHSSHTPASQPTRAPHIGIPSIPLARGRRAITPYLEPASRGISVHHLEIVLCQGPRSPIDGIQLEQQTLVVAMHARSYERGECVYCRASRIGSRV